MKDRSSIWPPLLTAGAAAVAAALAVQAFLIEPTRVEVTTHDLPLPDLPQAWEGARVVHLTDLHYGNPRSERLLAWMVGTVNELDPDLILITGDYVQRKRAEIVPCARHLSELRSRRGILGVMGDHDFEAYGRRPLKGILENLDEAGVCLLRNQSRELTGGLRITGIEPTTLKIWRGNLEAALRDLPGGGLPHLLLAHSPDVIRKASDRKIPMVLCGHTHGGQVVAPFLGPPVTHTRVGRRHASGWSSLGETRMYTGRGLSSHYSLRFLCRPEITLFTLRNA